MRSGTEVKVYMALAVFLSMTLLSACQSISGYSSPLGQEGVMIAVDFAQALVEGDYETAHNLLAPEIRPIMTLEQLRLDYEGMISFYSNPGSAHVLFDPQFTMTSWPGKRPDDIGWASVSIVGDDFVEAVSVIIAEVEGELMIREIEWGRP